VSEPQPSTPPRTGAGAASSRPADGTDSWSLYDAAWRLLPADDAAARRQFAQAWEAFAASGDAAGMSSCAAGVLIAIASRHADFRGVGLWLKRFDPGAIDERQPALRRLRADVTLTHLPSLPSGLGFRDPKVAAASARVYEVMRSDLAMPEDERIIYARALIDHWNLDNDPGRFRREAALLQSTIDTESASPFWAGTWYWSLVYAGELFGDLEAADANRARAWKLAEEHGLAELEYAMTAQDLSGLMIRGDLATAARKVARMNTLAPSVGPVWQGHGLVYEARFRLIRNEPELARSLIERALHLYEDTELSERERDMARSVLPACCLLLGEDDRAVELYEALRPNQSGGQLAMLEVNILAARAVRALRRGTPDFDDLLRQALGAARAIEWFALFFFIPGIATRLFDAALERDIEREYVTTAIRKRQLAPADPASERWPWAVRVRALGSFVVEREETPIAFERKAQKKPLELLKALVAAGGDGVARESLALQLWPDPDADALVAFDVTLSRLRKLVDVEGALLLADGKLSLNRRIVWCDTAAFEAACDRLAAALAGGDDAAVIDRLADTVFALYRDKLFGDEAAAPWSVAMRERLALRFNRVVAEVGAWRESRSEWRAAIACYERGLAQQMLAEPHYRGLMRCHAALGEPTEALLAFRRCRELLSMILGVKPSNETETLHRRIRGD
jgi:DNA-binding SARP family transcriptional activator